MLATGMRRTWWPLGIRAPVLETPIALGLLDAIRHLLCELTLPLSKVRACRWAGK